MCTTVHNSRGSGADSIAAQVAAIRTGPPAADFRFDAMAPVSPGLPRHLRDTMGYLHRALHAPDTALTHPLVLASAIDTAATAALAAFPDTATAATRLPSPGWVAPAAVRRAVAFIEACADQPLTVMRIAAEVGLSPRGLQAAFHRHLGTPDRAPAAGAAAPRPPRPAGRRPHVR